MYSRPVRRRAYGLAGAHARAVSADRHSGPYREFLRRHEMEAKQAAQGSCHDREEFAAQLLSRASDTRNLKIAIDHCASRGQAAGPNGLRPADLDEAARWNLARSLGPLIESAGYLPGKARRVSIDKGGNRGTRPIWVQDFEDRVVERAVVQVVQPLLEPQFLDSSLGYRSPGRSREKALALAERLAFDSGRWTWISEDFRDAFEQVSTGRLLQILRKMIPADEICNFVCRLVAKPSGRGIRQGGPLSPLLLNVYLHWVLDRWWRCNFSDVPMLRVADDLLILARPEEAESLYEALRQRSVVIGMPLKGSLRSSIRDMEAGEAMEWLGYQIRKKEALRVQVADKSWVKLEDHLHLAWEQPIPALSANDSIRGWISQQGAAYRSEDLERVFAGIQRRAQAQGFREIPGRGEVALLWSLSHHRDWITTRREVLLGERRRTELAEGFARQHWDSATSSRREAVAQMTAVPPPVAPIRREVSLYCDGSCDGRSRVGGWAYLLVETDTGDRQYAADSCPRTTNNRMELRAVLEGLKSLDDPTRVHLILDSKYVLQGLIEYLPEWISRGWRRRSGGRIANRRLWQRAAELLDFHEVDCQWVRGHSGQPENEFVDQLAREAAEVLT